MLSPSKPTLLGSVIAIALWAVSPAVLADHGHDDHHWRGGNHWHDDHHWHEGHWYHGDHGGHYGWWWLSAGMWSYYPGPIYPYSYPYGPPPVVVEPEPAPEASVPPPQQNWYYCKSARKYYPYVSNCAEGWTEVPAEPPN